MTRMGYHYTPCRRYGGVLAWAAVAVFVFVVVAIVAVASTIERIAVDLLEFSAFVLTTATVVGVVGGVMVLAIKSRRKEREARMRLTAVPVRPGMPERADVPALPRANTATHSLNDANPHVVTRQAAPRCRGDRR
jgi:hypothetical protein